MPKPYPSEFRDDVVRVARNRESGVTIEQIAKDFGVHTMTLQKWLQQAAVDDGIKPGQSRTEGAELREARKRIRLLEQEDPRLPRPKMVGWTEVPMVREICAILDELRPDVHIEFPGLVEIGQILLCYLRDRDIPNVDLLLADQIQQQVERAFVLVEAELEGGRCHERNLSL